MAELTYVCPNCGQPVSYSVIKFENGSEIQAPDWECKNCNQQIINFRPTKERIITDNITG